MLRNSTTENIDNATQTGIEDIVRIHGELIKYTSDELRSHELMLYESFLQSFENDWHYLKQWKRDKPILDRLTYLKKTALVASSKSIDKRISYYENRLEALAMAEKMIDSLVSRFERRIPRHEELIVGNFIVHNIMADLHMGANYHFKIDKGKMTLQDVKEEHERDYEMVRTVNGHRRMVKDMIKSKDAWAAYPITSWNIAEKRAPLIDVSIRQEDPSILYGGHYIHNLNETMDEMARNLRPYYNGRPFRKDYRRESYQTFVEEFNELQPSLDDAAIPPYVM